MVKVHVNSLEVNGCCSISVDVLTVELALHHYILVPRDWLKWHVAWNRLCGVFHSHSRSKAAFAHINLEAQDFCYSPNHAPVRLTIRLTTAFPPIILMSCLLAPHSRNTQCHHLLKVRVPGVNQTLVRMVLRITSLATHGSTKEQAGVNVQHSSE